MATDPIFAATVNVGSGLTPATADTSRTAPSNSTTVFTAGASGSKVESITVQGVGTTVAGVVCLFSVIGGVFRLIDEFTIAAVVPSTTVPAHREVRNYDNLVMLTGATLAITTQIAGNQSLVRVTAFGADF